MNYRMKMTLNTRLRRYRYHSSIRELMTDVSLNPQDLIAPLFIHDYSEDHTIDAMPFSKRYSLKGCKSYCRELMSSGIKAIALFPMISAEDKTMNCKAAFDNNGLMASTLKSLKDSFPDLVLIADVALDPFNPLGQDGIIINGEVDNDKTLELLALQSLCYAQAGADIIAPSDMMDGRVGFIRKALEENGFINTLILSYCVKFASNLYGPFRQAVDSSRFLSNSDKKSYQMDYRSGFQIALEAKSDEQESADLLLVKPGLHYLDVIKQLTESTSLPIWSYHVSGECVMLDLAAKNGIAPFKGLLMEALIAQRRAGAKKILTYFALEGAKILQE